MDTLRARPVSLVGLILSALRERFLWFLGGLVPRPLFALALELETEALRRDSPRTMAREERSRRVPGGEAAWIIMRSTCRDQKLVERAPGRRQRWTWRSRAPRRRRIAGRAPRLVVVVGGG